MNKFKKYPKIHRLGKEETDGILFGEVHVEEKIDGANVSIWVEDEKICVGSRNQRLSDDVDTHTEGKTFNGFIDYVRDNVTLKNFLLSNPHIRLYGEWLVRHTISYNETAYKKFYLFDVTIKKDEDEEAEEFWPREQVRNAATAIGVPYPESHGQFLNPSVEDLMHFVGKSVLGEKGEGIVLKNPEFRDKFGNEGYAKIVCEKFKENNGITFGGNNKHSDTYWEMYIVNKYMTLARIEKIMNKLQPLIDHRLHLSDIPRITNTAYHDMLTEEIWEIAKKVGTVDFKSLKRVAMKKAVQIYKDKLTGDISVADRTN